LDPFTQQRINEIVLWKHNRYVAASGEVLKGLNAARTLQPGKHRDARDLLRLLLKLRSCDLAVASTLLRFANPAVFQIMDRHAYRAVYGTDYPFIPSAHSKKKTEEKIETYFRYLDDVRELCETKKLQFHNADRVLYVFDRHFNGSLTKPKKD
jgi:hypothetical protein